MTVYVESWEGRFALSPENVTIRIDKLPPLILWLYRLSGGSGGTAIGFGNEAGDMIYAPMPNSHGVQPIYRGYAVLQDADSTAHVIVTYDVQGNGGQIVIEQYRYDGKVVSLESTMLNSGKPDFRWFRKDSMTSTPAQRGKE